MSEAREIMSLYETLIVSDKLMFPSKGKVNVSKRHGVYIIYNHNDIVLHVGMTPYGKGGLDQRLYNHISKAGVFYSKYLQPRGIEMRGKYFFRFIEVENPRIRALLEALTAGLLCPLHFGTGEKRNKS